MSADLSVLPGYLLGTIDRDSIVPFAEAAWFAWRTDRAGSVLDIRNGIWWRDDGKRVLSLATGADLHAWGSVDWETYPFVGAADGCCDDVCCHETPEAADACALVFLLEGRFCTDERSIEAAR